MKKKTKKGNPKYLKGTKFERDIVNQARDENKIAFRSAGSHSVIDVAVIDMEQQEVDFIQAKAGKGKYTKLQEKLNDMSGWFFVNFRVITKESWKKHKSHNNKI